MNDNHKDGLVPFKFPDTGKVVLTRKVSPLLVNEVQKAFPAPRPPMQEVDYGDGPVLEANQASPEYQQAMTDYAQATEERVRRLMIKRGTVHTLSDEDKKEVADIRRLWKEEFDLELPGDDLVVFISYICIGTGEDLEDYLNFLMKRSQPTDKEVEAAKAGFQS